ncbi:uncharacterized protein LOC143558430 [Bidens hawaiensis]|uniref:uncharacterized protein LOC143558430 n=1 Tax=Bidens hawaiensis TaxID=980011 RepID=UPI00404AACBF
MLFHFSGRKLSIEIVQDTYLLTGKKKNKGEDLKEVYWRAVRSYCVADYNEAIKEMTTLSSDAIEDFLKQNPKGFTRCFPSNQTKCDVIVSNMAETFNGYIIHARSKHIINMLEDIRVLVMTRLNDKKTKMLHEDVIVCPRIQLKLDKEKQRAYHCEVFPSSFNVFQVNHHNNDVSVDLLNKTCTCKKWDLTGIQCKHVCAVAGFLRRNAKEFVDECCHKDKYMKSYEFSIPPLPDKKY